METGREPETGQQELHRIEADGQTDTKQKKNLKRLDTNSGEFDPGSG